MQLVEGTYIDCCSVAVYTEVCTYVRRRVCAPSPPPHVESYHDVT